MHQMHHGAFSQMPNLCANAQMHHLYPILLHWNAQNVPKCSKCTWCIFILDDFMRKCAKAPTTRISNHFSKIYPNAPNAPWCIFQLRNLCAHFQMHHSIRWNFPCCIEALFSDIVNVPKCSKCTRCIFDLGHFRRKCTKCTLICVQIPCPEICANAPNAPGAFFSYPRSMHKCPNAPSVGPPAQAKVPKSESTP